MNYPEQKSAALHLKKAEEEALAIYKLHDEYDSLVCKILHPTSLKELDDELFDGYGKKYPYERLLIIAHGDAKLLNDQAY